MYDLLTAALPDGAAVAAIPWGEAHWQLYHSSLMLLECSELRHWRFEPLLDDVFGKRVDFQDWMMLSTAVQPIGSVVALNESWNSIDVLSSHTQFLHISDPRTQPWMTTLPWVESRMNYKVQEEGLIGDTREPAATSTAAAAAATDNATERYYAHTDPAIERAFFELLRDALRSGAVEPRFVEQERTAQRMRPDVWEMLAAVGYVETVAGPTRDVDTEPTLPAETEPGAVEVPVYIEAGNTGENL